MVQQITKIEANFGARFRKRAHAGAAIKPNAIMFRRNATTQTTPL
jgi:hypothetical protein